MTDARNFLLNTDYPMDKVIYMKSGSFNFGEINIPHGLGFMPLPLVQFSFDSDFNTCYEVTDRPWELYPSTFPYIFAVSSNSTNIKIEAYGFGGPYSTVYYRVLCFAPSNVYSNVTTTPVANDEFIINTDYNYTKLYMSGITNQNTTINHNLGYVPQVIVWQETDPGITPTQYYGFPLNEAPQITTTQLILPAINAASTIKRFHYRIYIDDKA